MFQRAEKGKEYEIFVLKIQKLEKLCNALQQERRILYAKIKEVHQTNSDVSVRVFGNLFPENAGETKEAEKPVLLSPAEAQELEKEDPVLTKDMARLREEQTRLQEFAASLFTTPTGDDDDEDKADDADAEEDKMASAFVQFTGKPQVKEQPVPVEEKKEEVEKVEEAQKQEAPKPEEKIPEVAPKEPEAEAAKVQTHVEVKEEKQVQPAEVVVDPPTEVKQEPHEVKPVAPVEEEKKLQAAQPAQEPQEPTPTTQPTPDAAAPSKKQAPKKKKKKGGKNAS